jgi:hypothetical protein
MSRLLRLPATTQNLYDDDDGSRYETYNNRVGAAGIMSGCGVRRFCPGVRVSRALAAVTLARALDLPASSTDHFSDDDGTGSEPYINAVADAGLIPACAAGRFCPSSTVLRGPVARYLRSGFGP